MKIEISIPVKGSSLRQVGRRLRPQMINDIRSDSCCSANEDSD